MCNVEFLLLLGRKEMETGLAPPSAWDLNADMVRMKSEQPLQVCAISAHSTN